MKNKYIVWFNEVDKEDVNLVGGKGASLGEMVQAEFPVPFGFIITSKAFDFFIKNTSIYVKISKLLKNLNYENHKELSEASNQIKNMIYDIELPNNFITKILDHYHNLFLMEEKYFKKKQSFIKQGYHKLTSIYKSPFVAVRSSATAEDTKDASFAGQQDSFLNVKGEIALIKNIKNCWASLYTERSIYYRKQKNIIESKISIAVVIQRMIQSEKSGISFSIDPITGNKNSIVIEAVYGLGEYIVQGKITPDHYEIDKNSLVLTKKEINNQKVQLIKIGLKDKEKKVLKKLSNLQKISDIQISEIALVTKNIEKHYFFPQDIEWSIEKNKIFIIQSRPITTIQLKNTKKEKVSDKKIKSINIEDMNKNIIAFGLPASPGVVVGTVSIIRSQKEISKIKNGDILVAPYTDPDFVPAMKKAKAIITEKGGRTSHAAIVARELGLPAIVGVKNATKILKDGTSIKVNGLTGNIYKANYKSLDFSNNKKKINTEKIKTLTKIYVNLSEPEKAREIAKKNVDGVGLLRAEFMIADIGKHPKDLIKKGKSDYFIDLLSNDLLKFASAFSPRPVIYRATDFKTNEYKHLKGGELYEPKEENPLIGYRGAIRYINNPDVFSLELEAIKKIWNKHYRNVHLMIPFIRRPWELIRIKEIMEKNKMFELPGFKLYIMVEVPSSAIELEKFIEIGIDGVSIGTNDLTMMLLGLDRDNENVSSLYDERSESVMNFLEMIVAKCKKNNIDCSICGQAASDYPEICEKLIHLGITSLSVNPDSIDRTRELAYNIERRYFKNNY
jgi:pyruvate,water dikinase